MKKILALFAFVLVAFSASAQVKIGYFSYNKALSSMPAYATVQADMELLRSQYEAELQRAEKEFTAKYEEFLEGYSTYAPSIRQKRQAELKDLMDRNLAFRDESKRLLSDAEAKAMAPVKSSLDQAIRTVGQKFGYIILLNTDNNACPYIDGSFSEDATELIIEAVK